MRKLKAMLGLGSKKSVPEQINPQIAIAIQRNEAASQRARKVLEEMLVRNDDLRGSRK